MNGPPQRGWNPGLHDAECFYAADPQGFFLAEADGQPPDVFPQWPMTNISALRGFILSCPNSATWESGMNWSGQHPPMPAAAAWATTPLSLSRKPTDNWVSRLAYRNIRYRGKASSKAAPEIIDLRKIPFGDLVVYDRAMFPAERPVFSATLDQPAGSDGAELRGQWKNWPDTA